MASVRTTRRDILKTIGLGSAALVAPKALHSAARKRKPNILFFLVDDMGWMDSSLYGSRYYKTPHIDRLAKRGMMFTDAYAANPLCSPTRASILTGKYPGRLKITTPAGHLPPQPNVPLMPETAQPWVKAICPRSKRFLPLEEYTIAEAFRNAGYDTGFIGKWHLGHEPWWPKKQGFDVNIAGGQYPGPPSYFSPYRIKTLPDGPKGEYITDRLTDEAVTYLEQRREKPFLLCMWHYAVHAPFQAKDEITKTYRDKVDPRGQQGCAVMASMLQSMDESLGRILDKLDELKIADDTIILFTSDNGGNMYNEVEGLPPTNNHPLRSGKGNIHEGGVREPCIVVWPGTVKPGSKSSEVISSIDYYPTMLAMAGLKPKAEQILDGESLMPVLTGGTLQREAIFCHFPHYIPATKNLPSTSVRKGKWKLIRVYGEGEDCSPGYELYDLAEDIGESNNLAGDMPEKVRELDALITQHLKRTDAIVPIPNPRYDPDAKPRTAAPAKPVAGWTPSRDCALSVRNGVLRVTCTGPDPYLHAKAASKVAGPLAVKLRIKCAATGEGQAFWTTAKAKNFGRDQRVTFTLTHDGAWREVVVKLPVEGKLTSLRLDPGAGKGTVEIDWVRLHTPNGTVVKAWEF